MTKGPTKGPERRDGIRARPGKLAKTNEHGDYERQDETMGVAINLILARQAVEHVAQHMTTGAANLEDKGWSDNTGKSQTFKTVCVRGVRAFKDSFPNPKDEADLYRLMQNTAIFNKGLGCGNCGEQAAMAFVYLMGKISPLEMVGDPNKDHEFVVIGRDAATNVSDPRTWNAEAVVCDPWDRRQWYPARLIPSFMYGGPPRPALILRLPSHAEWRDLRPAGRR